MAPTFSNAEETLLEVVNKPQLAGFYPGDIVALKNPLDESQTLIRRIMAGPGDEMVSDKGLPPFNIPDDSFWVACDNEGAAEDSRVFGPIAAQLLRGRAVTVVNKSYYPIGRIRNSENAMQDDQTLGLMNRFELEATHDILTRLRLHNFFGIPPNKESDKKDDQSKKDE